MGSVEGVARREIEKAREAEDWQTVFTLVDKHWSHLITDPTFLRDTLAAVPPTVLHQHPRWVTALGYLDHLRRGAGAGAFRNIAPALPADSLLDVLSQLTARMADRRARGSLADALEDVEEARQRLDLSNDAERASVQHALPHLLREWSRVYELTERTGDAHVLLQEAFDLAALTGDSPSAHYAAGRLAWLDAADGRHAASQQWATIAETHPYEVAHYDAERRLAHALRLADQLETEAAQSLLDTLENIRAHPESGASRQFVLAHTSTPATAPAALDDLLTFEASHPSGLKHHGSTFTMLTHAKVRLNLLIGDAAGALHATRDLPDTPSLLVARAAALLAADDNRAVLALTKGIRASVSTHPRWRMKLAAVEGVAYARLGAREAASGLSKSVIEGVPRLHLYSSLTLLSADDVEQLLGLIDSEVSVSIRERVLAQLSTRVVVKLSLLTRREKEVLRLLHADDSAERIAAQLFVSKNTVKSQMASMYRKLNVTSRDQVVALTRNIPFDID